MQTSDLLRVLTEDCVFQMSKIAHSVDFGSFGAFLTKCAKYREGKMEIHTLNTCIVIYQA